MGRGRLFPERLDTAAWAVIAVGALLRVARYAANRSLWGDEGSLAVNLMGRSLVQLAAPLELEQAAPIGFLWLEKAMILVLGASEPALRLVPLLAGLGALPLFYGLVRDLLERREALIASALFALSEPLIFYTSECKPYAVDVFVALLVTRAGLALLRRGASARRLAGLALAGGIGLWLSLSAVFVCAAWALTLIGAACRRSNARAWATALGVAGLWGAGFAAHYQLALADLPAGPALADAWQRYFPPSLVRPLDSAAWYGQTFLSFWNDPAGLAPRGLGAALFALGLGRWLRREPETAALLLGPVALALLAAAMHLAPFPTSNLYGPSDHYYPFFGRLILFSVPLALPFVARGVGLLLDTGWNGAAGWIAAAALLSTPAYWAAVHLLDPPRIHEARPLMTRIAAGSRADDLIFSQQYAIGVVTYYARRLGLDEPAGELVLEEPADVPAVAAQIASLRVGQRFWVVTLHHRHWRSERERDAIGEVLEPLAERLQWFDGDRAEATLWRRTELAAFGASAP